VALNAGKSGVRASQRIAGIKSVIESDRAGPISCCVACITGCWKGDGNVIRVVGSGPIHKMAAIAIGGQCRVVVVGVTLRARHCGVEACQWEY
jgi:hypothetical protein